MDVIKLKPTGDKCKLYTGTYAKAMQKLIADGRRPASVADITRERVNSANVMGRALEIQYASIRESDLNLTSFDESRIEESALNSFFWWFNYFHTADGFHNGKVILRPEQLIKGDLQADESLDGLVVEDLPLDERAAIFPDVRMDHIWSYLLRRGHKEYSENVDYPNMAANLSKRYFHHSQSLGIHKPTIKKLVPIRIQSLQKGSGLIGRDILASPNTRLIGIKDEPKT